MANAALTIVISAKDSATNALNGLAKNLKQLDRAATQIGNLGQAMSIGITAPLLGLGAVIGKLAIDAVESENLFDVSMKGMAESARAWSNDISKSLGLNAYEVRRSIGVFNSMFTSMGIGSKSALDMSEGLTLLANDMASFFNLRPDEAFIKLRSGIMGETEPLRQLGVVVDEATVKHWALQQGLISVGQELSQAQKVMARYGVIMAQTSNAQGDLARTMDSPANQLRRIKSQLEEVGIAAGQTFLPEMSRALSWISSEGVPKVSAALNDFKASWTGMSDEARQKVLIVAGLLVGGGPLLIALSFAFKAVVALGTAFTTLRLKAVAEILIIWRAAYEASNAFKSLANFLSTGQWGVPFDQYESWGKQVVRVTGDVMKLTGGVMELTDAMSAMGMTGIPNLADLGKSLSRPLVDMPKQADLEAAFGKLRPDFMGPASSDQLIKAYEQVNNVIIRSGQTVAAQAPQFEIGKAEWEGLGDSAQKAGADIKQAATNAIASTSQIVSALVSMHPAAIAAASSVASIKTAIANVQAAIEANNEAIHEAQAVLSGLQERVSQLSEALSKAKSRLEELASVRLPGMNAIDEQLFQIEQQLKRLKLAEMGMDASGFAPLTAEAQAFVATLPRSTAELEKMLQAMQLQKSLRYDEQLRKMQEAAKGVSREMGFEDAISQIIATRGEIGGLEASLAGAQQAVKDQQAAIAGLQEANYRLGKTLQGLQTDLAGAEEKQQAVNSTLEIAYQWLIEQRPELIKLGGEWIAQAGIIDEATRKLVDVTTAYSIQQGNNAAAAINAAIDAYNRWRALTGADLGGGIPGYANGTSYHPGGMAIVGERGPELINLPRGASVSPMRPGRLLGAGTPANQVINLTINIEGSVISERDLISKVRNELIRVGKRNVSVLE